MRTPINGARLSSGFGMRKHPIRGFTAMHKGVDFAAPYGTPVFAAGDGVLEKVGWVNGYGRYLLIRHNSTYKTAYAHLNGWASGIRRGARVSQGQTIGYVGSTGRSTGPHLHYEILINGKQVNPLGVKMPSGKPIPKVEMMKFKTTIKKMNLDLENYIVPKVGVYSSIVIVNKKIKKKAIVNIGYKPTFGKNKLLLEAHIFGLKKNLYDKSIKVMLTKFIRKEKKFKNIIQLKKQIKKDIDNSKK